MLKSLRFIQQILITLLYSSLLWIVFFSAETSFYYPQSIQSTECDRMYMSETEKKY